MNMKNRIVALYKNDCGFYEDIRMTLDKTTDEGDMEHFLMRLEDLFNQGYILQECFVTTDRDLYLKKSLESSLVVLKNLSEKFREDQENDKDRLDEEVIKEKHRLQREEEKTQMNIVGRRCSRCLFSDIEFTDEIALQCYDLYKKGLI